MTRQFTSLTICLVAAGMSLSAQTPVKSDYNADGKSDVLFFNSATSQAYELQMFNSSVALQGMVHTPAVPNWVIAASAINPTTRKSDLFWQNKVTGQVFKMVMNGVGFDATNSKFVYTDMNADWQLIMAADFDRDGIADLLFRNVRTGTLYLQPLNIDGSLKAGVTMYTEPNLNWHPVAVSANANMPGENDLIWYNNATGDVYSMLVNADGSIGAGSKIIYTASSTDWKLVSADDFNRDGVMDLLFWNKTTGDVYVVALDATGKATAASRTVHNANPASWEIVATGDYNGDGYADILWRNISSDPTVAGQLYMQFYKIDPTTGLIGPNTSDSTVVYQEQNLAWRPTGGLTSMTIEAPMTTATDNPITNTDTYSWKLVDPAVIKPGNFPKLYVTQGDPLLFSSSVAGPTANTGINWVAYKADNSADVTSSTMSGASFLSAAIQDVIVMAKSQADPTKVSARYVSVVAAPGVTTLSASPTTIAPGGSTVLTYSLTAGNTGVLTNDIDPNFKQTLTSASGTVTVSPAATTHYTLQAINQAGKTKSSTASVTVSANPGNSLDCTVTILGTNNPVGGNATSGSVYLVQVPAEPGVTYTWSVQGANLIAGQGTNQISVVIGPAGSSAVFTCRKDYNSAFNTGSLTVSSIAAPAVPGAITVQEVGTETTYVTAGKTVTAFVPIATNMTFQWTVTGATNVVQNSQPDGHVVTFTPNATGTVGLSVVELNAANTISTAKVTNRTIVSDPTNTVITLPTGFVTPGFAGNGVANVPNVGAGSQYFWTITPASGVAAAVNSSNLTPALSYTMTGGVAGDLVTLSCLITNGAGETFNAVNTKNAPVVVATQQICTAPVKPASFTFTAPTGKVTVGHTSSATVVPVTPTGTHTYDTMTYQWTVTNATIVSGQGTTTISYQPTNTGAVTFSVVEVNPANLSSAALTDNASITAVASPVINTFGITVGATTSAAGIITAGDTAKLAFSFVSGTAAIVDSVGAPSVTGIPSATTTANFPGLAANIPTAPHTLTLIVTNEAGDFATKTVTADVAAAPSITSFLPFTDAGATTAYTGTAVNFGTPLYLQPHYLTGVAASIYGGQTAAITPGNSSVNPADMSTNLIMPAEGTTVYTLTITNRAGKIATATLSTVVNQVAVTLAAPGMVHSASQTLAAVVTGAVNTNVTYAITSDSTGGATLTGAVLKAGPNAGNITVVATSVADPSKSATPVVIAVS